MPPRKHRSTAKAPVKTQINAHHTPPVPTRAVHSSSFARYNGPITRSRTARSLADAPIKQHGMDSLPFEVLSTIFILTLATDEEIVKRSSVGWTDPLPLCAVSSLWRTLALATPRLWSRVFVYVPDDMSKAIKSEELVPWIERSGTLPLTLFIWHYRSYWDASGIGSSVVKVLNRYASRWETLYVQYTNMFSEPRGNPLELVRLDKWSSLQRMHDIKPHDTITCAQLTHLQIYRHSRVSYAQVVHIFKGCPKLVWLSLVIHVAPELINVPASPIMLHDLSFASIWANHLSPIFQLVYLPSLRELVCRQIYAPTATGSLRSLLSLLTGSACTLHKLEIHGLQSLPGNLVQLLIHKSCNFLTSLGICDYVSNPNDGVPVNDKVLRILTLHHDHTVCTRLKFLSLHCQAAQCSQSALLKLVESRIGSCATSQPQDGLLYLHIENNREREPLYSQKRLYEVITRSEMEYESRDYGGLRLRRRGFRGNLPVLHDFFGT
jgi:hypothetical protein